MRSFLNSALFILSFSLFAIFWAEISLVLVLPSHPLAAPLFWVGLAGFLALLWECFLSRQYSELWFRPLQTLAITASAIGASALVTLTFKDWHLLYGPIGLGAIECLLVGVVAVSIARLLLRPQVPRQDA